MCNSPNVAALRGELPVSAEHDARQLLAWTLRRFGDRAVLASGLGPQSLVILDLVHRLGSRVRVLFLDTGLHFAETLELRREIERRYDIAIESITPEQTVAEQAATHGSRLWERDPDGCCRLRKVEPLRRALAGADAWITGIRRSHGSSRAAARSLDWDGQFGLVKVNPLVSWSRESVRAYLARRRVPTNPLLDDGYPSVGCAPCTARGIGERSGRWVGHPKTECGIHGRTEDER